MKFMEPIQTTMGTGLVVGLTGPGRLVATVTVVETAPGQKGKPAMERRRYPHRVFAWCERHRLWHPDGGDCPQCRASGEAAGE